MQIGIVQIHPRKSRSWTTKIATQTYKLPFRWRPASRHSLVAEAPLQR